MSLQLFNDYNLDIKVRSIDSYVPIGGGGSIPNNSIQNIKLFDKTIENTKIKDGTIVSSLLDANLTVSNDLIVNNDLSVDNDLIVNNNLIVNGNIDAQNGNLNVAGNISCTYDLEVGNNLLVNCNINIPNGSLDVDGDMNMSNGSINMNNGDINMLNGSISVGNYLNTTKLTLNNVGSYQIIGTAQLNAGTVIINTVAMSSTSYVFVQYSNVISLNHLSVLYVDKSDGSFQINSRDSNDDNNVDWMIINPA